MDRVRPQKRQIRKLKKRRIHPDDNYKVKHYMMLDRSKTCPTISRAHIKDLLALPMKEEGEKGLFESLIPKEGFGKLIPKESKEEVMKEEASKEEVDKENAI